MSLEGGGEDSGGACELSLIVPAWNEEAFLAETLSNLHAAMAFVHTACGASAELIVVDNNSSDATASIAKTAGARVVFEPHNQIARARNAGAAQASGSALVFVDADTQVPGALLEIVVSVLRTDQYVGGGACLALDADVSRSASLGLNAWNAFSVRFGFAAGSFVWCRADAFRAVGGFSEAHYAGEELVLSRRLRRWGKRHGMRFKVLGDTPVVTSARKLEWYSPMDLLRQIAVVLIPGALRSKRLMRTWYDDAGRARLRRHEDGESDNAV